jgi:MerR family transcriptional regulator, thiopeptide resistance regulator
MSYTVGHVARLAGITVRTLHHYDDVGLLSPSERSTSGYRRYVEADLDQLAQILRYRELGYSLEQIRRALDTPQDAVEALRRQRVLLEERMTRLARMIRTIDRTIEARRSGDALTAEELLGLADCGAPSAPDGR